VERERALGEVEAVVVGKFVGFAELEFLFLMRTRVAPASCTPPWPSARKNLSRKRGASPFSSPFSERTKTTNRLQRLL